MSVECYEFQLINNSRLPEAWKSQNDLDNLEEFLQQNWEQRYAFYNDSTVSKKQQFLSFLSNKRIKTNKYIGTVSFKGEQINIYPKMFKTDIDDRDTSELNQKHLMKNVVEWVNYCTKTDYPFINSSLDLDDTDDFKELFITIYLNYVTKALERGLYYQYIEETDDLSSIKGKFDVKDYICNKLPNGNGDKFNCAYSKFEYDNKINRIIKCTCKMLINMSNKSNQNKIRHILMKMSDVSDEQMFPSDCDGIRFTRRNQNFNIIISMSKMFLLNKFSSYSLDTSSSFCFLFPTDMLFEGFVGGYFKSVLTEMGGNAYLQKSDSYLFDEFSIGDVNIGPTLLTRYDILIEYKQKLFILDTKYKETERFEYNDGIDSKTLHFYEPQDCYQICEYAREKSCKDVYLLYPMYRYEEPDFKKTIGLNKGTGDYLGLDIVIHFVRLPFIFEENETTVYDNLKKIIQFILDDKI